MSAIRDSAATVIGAWSLEWFRLQHQEFGEIHPFGIDVRGSLIFASSARFSLQVMRTGRPKFASGEHTSATREEMEAAYKGSISYYGSYEQDSEGSVLTFHIEQALCPNWDGESWERTVELQGDLLTLTARAQTAAPAAWGGADATSSAMQWRRVG